MNIKVTFSGIIFFTIALFGCGEKVSRVVIDNPSDENIRVGFSNGFETEIEAGRSQTIQFKNTSSVVYLNGTELDSISVVIGEEYILNPTQSNYYIEAVGYSAQHSDPRGLEIKMNEAIQNAKSEDEKIDANLIMIDSMLYMGYVKETNDILIRKFWDYDLKDYVPGQIEVKYDALTIRKKIYRESDFLRTHEFHDMRNLGGDGETVDVEE